MPMSDDQLVSIVDNEFSSSMGREGNEISAERALAWDYYMSRPWNEVDGQSTVRTSDVSDVIDAIMPQLLRIFSVADNLVEFDPVSLEDQQNAQEESDAVRHVFFKKNPAFMILFTWFMDTLMQKNGIVKCWWDETKKVTKETYEGLSEMEMAELINDPELEPIAQEVREEVSVVEIPMDDGRTVEAEIVVPVYDITFRRTQILGRVTIEPVPPNEYRISSDAKGLDPNGSRMVGHEREVTRSDAIQMGFPRKVVMALPASSQSTATEEKRARDHHAEEDKQQLSTTDPSMENILLREAYIWIDYDEDDIAELRQIYTCESTLLGNEEIDRQPFHVLSAKPLPHKHFGRAVADLVMDIQDVQTTLLRQAMDNIYLSNSPGHGVWEMAMGENTLEDLLVSQAGRIVRFDRPPSEGYMPITVPFVADKAFPTMEYFERLGRRRTGVTDDGEGLNPEILKNIQQGVMSRAIDMSLGKIELVARIFSETGIKTLMLHIHELLRKHQTTPMMISAKAGGMKETSPLQWLERDEFTCNIGLGLGNRDTNLLHLDAIWQKQVAMVEGGGLGVTVTPKNLYNTAREFVKNANLRHPEMFFTDPPDDLEIPPKDGGDAEVQKALIEVEAQKVQLDAQEMQLKNQREMFELQQKQEKIEADYEERVADMMLKQQAQADKMTVEMEKIANALTEMELKYGSQVPGSKV